RVLFRSPYATFTVTRANGKVEDGKIITVKFNDLTKSAAIYNDKISISPVNKDASVLNLSIVDAVPEKAEDIIDKLIEVYNREAVEDKNQLAQNTVRFIDERLLYLEKELEDVERNVEAYKKENRITYKGTDTQQYIQDASLYGKQFADIQTQISIVESMEG